MQIDDRSHVEFLLDTLPNGTPKWQHPAWNLMYGAHHLSACLRHFSEMRWLTSAQLREAAGIAAYNCGIGGVLRGVRSVVGKYTEEQMLEAIDSRTANKHYARDVLRRRQGFIDSLRAAERAS